jgi:hypothetical protein
MYGADYMDNDPIGHASRLSKGCVALIAAVCCRDAESLRNSQEEAGWLAEREGFEPSVEL